MKILYTILLSAVTLFSFGQIPNGTWRDHLSYTEAIGLVKTPSKIFCYYKSGGMLSYDLGTGEVNRWNTVTGLSESGISALAYDDVTNTLVVGYMSGGIDLIKSHDIVNMDAIKRKDTYPNKSINNIYVNSGMAYLSCEFGVVLIDIEKEEIKDSYIFGPQGNIINTNDITILDNTIYAATEEGLYTASLSSPNLVDYGYWTLDESLPEPTGKYREIEAINGKLLLSQHRQGLWNALYFNTGNGWSWSPIQNNYDYYDICFDGTYLTLSGLDRAEVFNADFERIVELSQGEVYGTVKSGERIFTASIGGSFATWNEDGVLTDTIKINSLIKNNVGRITTKNNNVWVTTGGKEDGYIYHFYDNKWNIINLREDPVSLGMSNSALVAVNPNDENHIMAGSFMKGMANIKNNKVINYSDTTEPVFQMIRSDVGLRTNGCQFDNKGNCWFLLEYVSQPVFVYRNDNTWEQKNINISALNKDDKYSDMLITSTGQVWILSLNYGISVFKENYDGSISTRYFTLKNQDNEGFTKAYCLAEDKDGSIWVGTND
ncbi:MAG: hypothetical protein MI922_03745, partial [Bacteroidales bacterium]|nr:hypothetical protein [Bacteroidales bacterium]